MRSSGGASANVSQRSNSAETKPVVRRIENCGPSIFDLRERDDEVEGHGLRVIHFYVGDDDDDDDDDEQDLRMWPSLVTVELMWHYSL